MIDFSLAEFKYRSDWKYLKYAFRARDVDHEIAEEIHMKKGIGWSPMNLLPGWMPGATNVTEMMHALYLCLSSFLELLVILVSHCGKGLVKHLTKDIIVKSGMLNAVPKSGNNPLQRLEDFFKRLIWPQSVSRLPPSVSLVVLLVYVHASPFCSDCTRQRLCEG